MLGISTGLMYQGFVDSIAMSPNEINDNTDHTCLFWYDFTDTSTMYTNTGSTNVSSDNDLICRIDNKSTLRVEIELLLIYNNYFLLKDQNTKQLDTHHLMVLMSI